jgi:hypothetical protein
VIHISGGQGKLEKDAADVFLDCPLGDYQAGGDG